MRPLTKISVFGVRLACVLLAIYWLAIFTGTHLPNVLAIPQPNVSDKVKHFVAYFVLGAMMCYVTNSENWVRRFLGIGLIGMAYALIDELTQQLVPGRHCDPLDFFADSLGLWCAIGIYVGAKYVRNTLRTDIAAS